MNGTSEATVFDSIYLAETYLAFESARLCLWSYSPSFSSGSVSQLDAAANYSFSAWSFLSLPILVCSPSSTLLGLLLAWLNAKNNDTVLLLLSFERILLFVNQILWLLPRFCNWWGEISDVLGYCHNASYLYQMVLANIFNRSDLIITRF